MRTLQYAGIIVGLLIAGYALWKRKRRRFTRLQFFIVGGIAGAIFLISFFPAAGDLIAGPLRMERWNAVLSTAVLALTLLFFYVLNIANSNSRTISRLIKALAAAEFAQEHPDGFFGEIMAIIPAYNEGDNLEGVLRQMPTEVCGLKVQALVAVDGATDNTEEVARRMGAAVIVNPINRGGGAALRAGYEVALRSRAKIVVTLDADGQHLPEEMEMLVRPIVDGEADFVNGSRVLGSHEAESQVRVAGVFMFNWLISILMFKRITDASNAYRAMRTDLLHELTLYQDQFHTSEMLIEALKKGARVIEVPITIKKRQSGVSKKPMSFRYGWGFTKAILGTWLR
jgi:hypothetical protein